MPYLSQRALGGLKQYEYKSGGYTWLDDLHQPFWNWSTARLPLWLAPNLITLTGLTGLVAAYIIAFIYLPGFEGHAPTWVYLFGGTAALAYLHLDCIDGKQARRTKSSSPLGQLFDHGCDAVAVHLLLTTVACSLNLGGTWKAVAASMAIMVPWGYAHWEEYHDGTMLYGNGVWGITEANYALVILHYITVVAGPDMWDYNLQETISFLPFHLSISDSLLAFVSVAGMQQLSGQIWRTLFTSPSVRLGPEDAGHKQLGYGYATSHLLQLALVLGTGVLAMLEATRHQIPMHGRAVAASFGVVYALQSTRLIMAHMTKEPFSVAAWPVILLGLGIANDRLQLLNLTAVAWVILLTLLTGYLHYVIAVIGQICQALNINCLTIKHRME